MSRVLIPLMGPDKKKRVVNPHAKDNNGEHERRNIKRSAHEPQGSECTDIGKADRKQSDDGQWQAEIEEQQYDNYTDTKNEQDFGKCCEQQFAQLPGKKTGIVNAAECVVFFIECGPVVMRAWFQGNKADQIFCSLAL